ncbi:holin [Sporolactobacillus terrae]|nr:holin [Sporolactobacillus terrae]QAA27027.1 holin [Sporolactobacillus terrae]UAK17955.1 holin [Sporolactobacillus terrae]
MNQILLIATLIAPITTALVQAVKQTGKISDNDLPLSALGIGIFLGFCASFLFTDVPIAYLVWAGGISGLAATGLFETFKHR